MIAIEILKDVKLRLSKSLYNKYYNGNEEMFVKELKKWFFKNLGHELDLESPRTFNQKIQWLKLYDSTEEKALLADKLRCRPVVADIIGEQYLIPLLGNRGGYSSFDDIDFSTLPDSFVIKANHGSSTNIIVKDKKELNLRETRMKFNRWMKKNYGFKHGFELHYGMIQPRILIEKYMGPSLNDYKLFCFGGKPEFFWVDTGRYTDHCRNSYDLDWNELPFIIDRFKRVSVDRPKNLELMIQLAEKLSKGFAFVRVDFYEIDGNLYFGEMTFTSSSGRDKFYPESYDEIIGEKLSLPEKKEIPIKQIRDVWKSK